MFFTPPSSGLYQASYRLPQTPEMMELIPSVSVVVVASQDYLHIFSYTEVHAGLPGDILSHVKSFQLQLGGPLSALVVSPSDRYPRFAVCGGSSVFEFDCLTRAVCASFTTDSVVRSMTYCLDSGGPSLVVSVDEGILILAGPRSGLVSAEPADLLIGSNDAVFAFGSFGALYYSFTSEAQSIPCFTNCRVFSLFRDGNNVLVHYTSKDAQRIALVDSLSLAVSSLKLRGPLSNPVNGLHASFSISSNYYLIPTESGIYIIPFSKTAPSIVGFSEEYQFFNPRGTGSRLFALAKDSDALFLFDQDPPEGVVRDVFIDCSELREQLQFGETKDSYLTPELLPERCTLATNFGDIEVMLFPSKAPKAVANFVSLIKSGFYRQMPFHRVIKGFLIQTGCPNHDGTGSRSIFTMPDGSEGFPIVLTHIPHDSFTVGCVNDGSGRNGSQFYITCKAEYSLDTQNTAFGRVTDIESQYVVRTLADVQTDARDRPLRQRDALLLDILLPEAE